jgi:hypothetical protein
MFCSATYRLFKLPKGDKSSPLQVIYSGDVTGCEEKLDFEAIAQGPNEHRDPMLIYVCCVQYVF